MTESEEVQLEKAREDAQKLIEKGEALKRLLANPDYQLIISEGYFKEYPRMIAEAIANNTGAYDADVLCTSLKAINTLKGYEFRVASGLDAGIAELKAIDDLIANSVNDTEYEDEE